MGELPPKPPPEVKPEPQKLNWRELQIEKTGKDPLICPRCGIELEYKKTCFPRDEGDEIAFSEAGLRYEKVGY